MFEQTRHIQNSIVIVFPQILDVARFAGGIEDILRDRYNPAVVLNMSGPLEPIFPQLIFQSDHGFSQIQVSQSNITLNVNYSPDWQLDPAQGRSYLLERVPILFDIVKTILSRSASVTGITTVALIPSSSDDEAVISHLMSKLLREGYVPGTYEVAVKKSSVVRNLYFSNVTYDTYRNWSTPTAGLGIVRMTQKSATDRGLRVLHEMNDRFAYNEVSGYFSSAQAATDLIESAFDRIQSETDFIRSDG